MNTVIVLAFPFCTLYYKLCGFNFKNSVKTHPWVSKVPYHSMHVCSLTPHFLWPCGLYPARLLSPWNFSGKNTGVGCHFLLQGIFPTLGLTHISCISCIFRWILCPWVTRETPVWVSKVQSPKSWEQDFGLYQYCVQRPGVSRTCLCEMGFHGACRPACCDAQLQPSLFSQVLETQLL